MDEERLPAMAMFLRTLGKFMESKSMRLLLMGATPQETMHASLTLTPRTRVYFSMMPLVVRMRHVILRVQELARVVYLLKPAKTVKS
jgi:hypothetical protein